ncbi:hypothetical protein JOH51_007310 [Rhizobium leguminosarum]|nr:hypothetical protein [Rhizobium leguminosarum]
MAGKGWSSGFGARPAEPILSSLSTGFPMTVISSPVAPAKTNAPRVHRYVPKTLGLRSSAHLDAVHAPAVG